MGASTADSTGPDRIAIVVFDIGGVLISVNETWAACLDKVGISHSLDPNLQRKSLPKFQAYETGQISFEEYIADIANFLSLSEESARLAHQGILGPELPGVNDLVQSLQVQSVRSACLSNTNAPHWVWLTDPHHYPTIASLPLKVGSHQVNSAKPSPEIYRRFEDLSGVQGSSILFFDDLQENVKGAQNEGWHAFQVPATDQAKFMTSVVTQFGLLGPPLK